MRTATELHGGQSEQKPVPILSAKEVLGPGHEPGGGQIRPNVQEAAGEGRG